MNTVFNINTDYFTFGLYLALVIIVYFVIIIDNKHSLPL